jgi:hypothetical protein
LLIVFMNPDIIPSGGGGSGIPGIPNTPTPAPVGTGYEGPVTIRFPAYDTLDSSLEYGEDTEVDSIVYHPTTGQRLTAPSGSSLPYTATVTVSSTVQTVKIGSEVTSGQDYYIDVEATKLANSGRLVGEPEWTDMDNDGRNEWVWTLNVAFPAGTDPDAAQIDFQTALLDEGSIDVDSPVDIDVDTTGKQRCNIKWSIDLDNDGDGEVLTRLRITLNSTDPSGWYVNDNNIRVPSTNPAAPNDATQTLYFSQAEDLELASTYRYDFEFGDGDVNGGLMLYSPLNGEQEFEMPVEFWINQDVLDDSGITLEAQTVDAFGVYTTNSDTVWCGENVS